MSTVPYNPKKNGLAERIIVRRWKKLVVCCSMVAWNSVFGAEVVATAVHLISIKMMCHIPKVQRKKLDPKSEAAVFVVMWPFSKMVVIPIEATQAGPVNERVKKPATRMKQSR